ncbi:MAG: hypothetical protein DRN17_06490 [Thermoplasmata archaeon]|nr:MAG: hypothetical protein DRN17_06490 [Thermoplasmata archaeon]
MGKIFKKLIMLSTAHITVEDNDKFMERNSYLIPMIADYDGGWFFYKPDSRDEMIKDLKEAGISDSGIKVFEYAFFENGGDFLRLDRDGDTVKKLPKFDW